MMARIVRLWYVDPQVLIGVAPNIQFSVFFGR